MEDKELEQFFDVNKYKLEYEFLQWHNKFEPFPYFWLTKYDDFYQVVHIDEHNNLPYVVHKSKRLYFPEEFSINQVQDVYRCLMIENDNNSPHKYFTDSFGIESGDIFFDIGAAEAWVTLENIEKIKHAYIMETDHKWVKPLQATFAPYKNKITMINKFASNFDGEDNVKIDSIGADIVNQNIVIKIDVEGAEYLVVEGMQKLLRNNKVKMVLCTYHKAEDFKFFQRYFIDRGYETQTTDGYMFYPIPVWNMEEQYGVPSMRKGLLRLWRKSEYPHIEKVNNSTLYVEEPLYKHIAMLRSAIHIKDSSYNELHQKLEKVELECASNQQYLQKLLCKKRKYKLFSICLSVALVITLIKLFW